MMNKREGIVRKKSNLAGFLVNGRRRQELAALQLLVDEHVARLLGRAAPLGVAARAPRRARVGKQVGEDHVAAGRPDAHGAALDVLAVDGVGGGVNRGLELGLGVGLGDLLIRSVAVGSVDGEDSSFT